jgi:hemolysin type calcium-binding protein
MRGVRLAVIGCAALIALASPAAAAMRADLDAGTLVLADADGTADQVTLSDRVDGPFVQVGHGALAGAACPAAQNVSFAGFQCAVAPLVLIDAGAGDDTIDAARLSAPLSVTLGPGNDVLQAGKGNDTVVVADGQRDVVECGPGQDVVDGVVDPNDDIDASCETAQRTFVGSLLPKSAAVAAPSTVAIAIGRANVPLRFEATMSTAPPKHGKHAKTRSLAHASLPATTGAVKLKFKLPNVSKGSLSKRPDIRVQVAVTAIGADGQRYPLALHSRKPGPHPKLVTLYDNQVRLTIPARLRHPHGG